MKVWVVAPGIDSPWTEGRKNFVRDVVRELQRSHDVTTITTGWSRVEKLDGHVVRLDGRRFKGMPKLLSTVAKYLSKDSPDLVLYFPYGTFRGVRRVATEVSISALRRMALRASTQLLIVLYSIDGYPSRSRIIEATDVLAADVVPPERRVPVGVATEGWAKKPNRIEGRRLLFMAGMAESREVNDVLHKRGLRTLLLAGDELASKGFTLTAAVPTFRDQQIRQSILGSQWNTWPTDTLLLRGEVEVPLIYHESDLYVFAYAEGISSFCPTSVVESMMSGTPVVLADHPWLRRHVGGEAAEWFTPQDRDSLIEAVNRANERKFELAIRATQWAETRFGISNSVKAILRHRRR